MGFSVTDPLRTLFTMTRSVSSCDLVLAMYELCGWFSVFKPSPAVDMALEQAKSEEEQYTTESLFELDETQDEAHGSESMLERARRTARMIKVGSRMTDPEIKQTEKAHRSG